MHVADRASAPDDAELIRGQIRDSGLLVVGRVIALAVNLGSQVVIVRYLSKESYGAFAYGLAIALAGQTVAAFGLDRAISRFVPIYHERGEYRKLFGTIVLVVGTIAGLGALIVGVVYLLEGLGASPFGESQTATLLLILILLAPIQAFDSVVTNLFAVYGRARAIFLRTYLLAPLLRLVVVGLLVGTHSSATFLAVGYVAAAALGVAVYAPYLLRQLARDAAAHGASMREIEIPGREILTLTVPLLTTSLVWVLIGSTDVILLQRFGSTVDVGAFRAIQPAAELNQFVILSFAPLFTPLAARLFARGNRAALDDLYWQTAAWIATLSFPILVLTSVLAHPLTTTLYGSRYAGSAAYLTILAVGYYVQAALGSNGVTLSIFRAVRWIVTLNVLAVLVNLGLNLVLIPPYGALGAAIGTTGTLVAHNVFKQVALRRATGLSFFRAHYLRIYGAIALGFSLLLVTTRLLVDSLLVQIPLCAVVCVAVVVVCSSRLEVDETFPEVRRLLPLPWALRGRG